MRRPFIALIAGLLLVSCSNGSGDEIDRGTATPTCASPSCNELNGGRFTILEDLPTAELTNDDKTRIAHDAREAVTEYLDHQSFEWLPAWKQLRYKVMDIWFWSEHQRQFGRSDIKALSEECEEVPAGGFDLGIAAQDPWFHEKNEALVMICDGVREQPHARTSEAWVTFVQDLLRDPPCSPGTIYSCPPKYPRRLSPATAD